MKGIPKREGSENTFQMVKTIGPPFLDSQMEIYLGRGFNRQIRHILSLVHFEKKCAGMPKKMFSQIQKARSGAHGVAAAGVSGNLSDTEGGISLWAGPPVNHEGKTAACRRFLEGQKKSANFEKSLQRIPGSLFILET
jgi:hypothetical protein